MKPIAGLSQPGVNVLWARRAHALPTCACVRGVAGGLQTGEKNKGSPDPWVPNNMLEGTCHVLFLFLYDLYTEFQKLRFFKRQNAKIKRHVPQEIY